jgi:iron complex outermembrane receptor protein
MVIQFQRHLLATLVAGVFYGSIALAAEVQNYQVQAGPLDEVLLNISRQSGQVVTFGGEVSQFNAPAIEGSLSAEQAVRRAIEGTGLQLQVTSSGALVVLPQLSENAAEGDGALLDVIDVEGRVANQSSDYGDVGFQAYESGTSLRLADTPQREMPMTVNVMTKEAIRTRAPSSVAEAVRQLPGVSLNSSETGTPEFTIRGFRSSAIYVNGQGGTPVGGGVDNSSAMIPVEDIERVELLKGPTSILTGVSSSGGAVNVTTKQPSRETIRDLTFGYGSWNQKKLGLDMGGVFAGIDSLTYRMNVAGSHSDENYAGYRDPYYYLFSPSIKWSDDSSSVLAGVRYYKQKTVPKARTFVPRGTYFGSTVPSVLHLSRDNAPVNRGLYNQNETLTTYTDVSHDFGTLADLVNIKLDNHLSFAHSEYEANTYSWNTLRQSNGNYRIQQARTESDTDRLVNQTGLTFKADLKNLDSTTKFGLDYKNIDLTSKSASSGFTQIDAYSGRPHLALYSPALVNVTKYDTSSRGYYVIQKFDLFERFHLFGQKRRDVIDEDYRYRSASSSSSRNTQPDGDSWVLGAAVDITDGLSIYGNRSKGYVPTTSTGYNNQLIPEEERDQREVGARVYLFDQALTLTASYYELEQTNVSICNPDAASCFDLPTILVPGQISKGYELELQGEVYPGVEITASFGKVGVSYQDEGYTYPFTSVPRYTGSLWALYRPQTDSLRRFTFGAGVSGNSSSETNNAGSGPQIEIPGYAIMDALVGYDLERWSFQFKVNNLANKYYYQGGTTSSYINIGEGRNFLFSARYSFE